MNRKRLKLFHFSFYNLHFSFPKISRSSTFVFYILYSTFFISSLLSCSVQKQVAKNASANILNKPEMQTAHVGIAVYDVDAKKFLYQYNSDKYFIPASNTKLFTCYAAMKYLGDSLPGMRITEDDNNVYLFPTGDPSLLMTDFKNHPVINQLKQYNKPFILVDTAWKEEALGFGWSWDDYNDDYMAERSIMPLYGNMVTFSGKKNQLFTIPALPVSSLSVTESYGFVSNVKRNRDSNYFKLSFAGKKDNPVSVPFATVNGLTNIKILSSILNKNITIADSSILKALITAKPVTIYSQPTDSLLSIMMHRSDNFFAEQSLLMVSNEKLGVMNDEKIIGTLLNTDLKDLPRRPEWVDGSGLSRYNLFTPEDFIFILNKLRNEFDWKRITTILPTGGTGTISNYYKNLNERIFVKTGTLSNNIALSGYLVTKKNKTLLFSVLVSNHMANAGDIRKDVEAFINGLADKN